MALINGTPRMVRLKVALFALALLVLAVPLHHLEAKRNARYRQTCERRLAIARSSTDTLAALLSKPVRFTEDCQWWLSSVSALPFPLPMRDGNRATR